MRKFTDFYSATVLGTGNNNGIRLKEKSEYVFKSFYRLRAFGENSFKLFFINEVETTGHAERGTKGGKYEIVSAKAEAGGSEAKITFDGKENKTVLPSEMFETDEFELFCEKDGYLVLSFVVRTDEEIFLPTTYESASKGVVIENDVEKFWDNHTLRPVFVGIKKDKKKTVGFFGDSITQGTRTGVDKYEAWTHRIGMSLDEDVSFWNLGMGWSRAYDASAGEVFLKKAMLCDEVFMCFGVNDIRSGQRTGEELIGDLKKVREELEKAGVRVYNLTVPPFNMTEYEEEQRKKANEYIRTTKDFFDIASVLERDDLGGVKKEFMASEDDSHPNGKAGEAIFEAFEKWREETGW